jgi:uracil-DNA glycosylase
VPEPPEEGSPEAGSPQAGSPEAESPEAGSPEAGSPGTGSPSFVPPGSGWPEDPATLSTPVAQSPADVRALAAGAGSLAELAARESVCRACDRLVRWRELTARTKRRSFQADTYWGRPVPSWGDPEPSILIVGLAPAAHGGNRTGRIFTGDRSGDFLFASLWRCGLAVQPTSTTAGDGQRLISVRMAAAVHCAPPDNKPAPAERDTCAAWLAAELALLNNRLRVVVCLGHFAWQALWPQLVNLGLDTPRPRPAFGHGAEVALTAAASVHNEGRSAGADLVVLGCYHPSQQNTFTGRVTEDMLDAVFRRAADLAAGD